MKLSVQFVTGLLLAAGVLAGPIDSAAGTAPVALERRNLFITADDILDFFALGQHFKAQDNKFAAALDNYERNTGSVHPLKVEGGAQKRATGDLNLTDIQNDQLYAGKLTFGGQTFAIDFDTGSADTLANPGAYNPSKSKTSKNTGASFSAAYGDGTSARGTIYTDSFSIAGLKANNVAIGRSSNTFITGEDPNQGIAGLSFPSIQTFPKQYAPFFQSLRDQKAVSQGVFQFTLKHGAGSSLFLGGVDASKAKGGFKYTNVQSSLGFWISKATINGKAITAIVDSGSTIISGPTSQVRSVVSTIPGLTPIYQQGSIMYVYNCAQTPSITISIAGLDVKLGKAQTRYGKDNLGRCVLPIVGQSGMPMNAWILGDTFFQMTSIVFDMDKSRMGFALQA